MASRNNQIVPTIMRARPLLSANISPASFALPSSDSEGDYASTANYGVFDVLRGSVVGAQFFGVGADNSTFDLAIYGIKQMESGGIAGDHTLDPIARLTATLGTHLGRDGGTVEDENRYADTLAVAETSGFRIESSELVSPGDNTKATLRFNNDGYKQILIAFDMTGATSGNALIWMS